MPRGRPRESPGSARRDSERRILAALQESGLSGLRFNELRRTTGLHQDTLTERMHSLVEDRKVSRSPFGTYLIRESGVQDLSLGNLLFWIQQLGPDHASLGGPASGSVDAAEDAVLKSTTSYAIPGLPPGWLSVMLRTIHDEYASLRLETVCENLGVPLSSATGAPDRTRILEALKTSPALRGKQVLAFVIDLDALRGRLTESYLLRAARRTAGGRGISTKRHG